MPGLRGMELFKAPRNMLGKDNPYYLIATLTFDNLDALKAAMASPEGKATGANIMGFAAGYLTMLTSEVEVTEGAAV
jgi:uncharacterized protein (TIGR02118 family)